MIRRFSSLVLSALFTVLVMSAGLTAVPAGADDMSGQKGGMIKEKQMVDDSGKMTGGETMMKEPDSMIADTVQMMDESEYMSKEGDKMMDNNGKMMDDNSGKSMK